MFVWSLMKRLARVVSLERRARLLGAVVPSRYWFETAVLMSRWHARITSAMGKGRRGISEAYMRENWLIEFTKLGSFPIPMQVSGAALLEATASDRGGIVLCGTHVPLIMVVIRAAIQAGCRPDLVVADPNNMRLENNAFQPTGLSEGIPATSPGPSGLLKIRTVLRRRGLVACTLDGDAGGPSHPDLLILAGRLGARIVTFRANLMPNGVVNISFQNAVYPFCDSDEAIEANMRAIQEDERRLLASLDDVANSDVSIAVLSQPDVLTDTRGKIDEDDNDKPRVKPTTKKVSARS